METTVEPKDDASIRPVAVAETRRVRARRRLRARLLVAGLVALFATAVVIAALPKPAPVEEGAVRRGPFELTIDESGKTRVRDRYTVYSPLGGELSRVELRAGDRVEKGAPLARLVPMAPALLDPRARAEATARISAAQAAERQARANVARAEIAATHAEDDLTRTRALVESGSLSADAGRNAELEARLRNEELSSARFSVELAAHEVEVSRATLLRFGDRAGAKDALVIPSPVSGRVLRVMQQSAGVVGPSTPILEMGDPGALEVVVDVLTSDAVRVAPGARVRLEQWGGERPLAAHVRLIEPSAFTKISALGVEEQRVNVVIDFDDPKPAWERLGDGYRVEARIVTATTNDALLAPASAFFRHGDAWAVFVDDGGRARLRPVSIGGRNATDGEIVAGLRLGERVVIHPSSAVVDGARIAPR